ncbi:MAG: UDP-N-acetylmuramoyl-L-alanyl-D-glutamate--2,6-diaminopimelate ligase, partial [Cereibacter sp.]
FEAYFSAKAGLFDRVLAEDGAAVINDNDPRGADMAGIAADRGQAILRGVDALGPGDALLIAGKGHETGQTIAGHVYPFDDAEQASVAVAALDGLI